MAWNQFDPKRGVIELRRRKTKKPIAIPVLPELREWLEQMPRISPLMIASEATGRSYKEDHFRHLFATIREAAGLRSDLWFMDLRRTVATPLGAAGCTDDQIRAVTGHTDRNVVRRYVRPDDTMARVAMERRARNKISTATENPDGE